MTTRESRAVVAQLTRKGFRLTRDTKHTHFRYWTVAGEKTPYGTHVSHGHRELHDQLLGWMAKQCGVSKAEFLALVDCPLSRESYEALLRTK